MALDSSIKTGDDVTGQPSPGTTYDVATVTLSDGRRAQLMVAAPMKFDWDYCLPSPAANPTTITYKKGGSGGTTVAVCTVTYSGSDIASISWAYP